MNRGHAERLFPMIDELMAEAGCSPGDLSRIAVCTGPGSFTGLRVGVAAARGLALGLGIPAIGVTRFEALIGPGEREVTLPGRGGTIYRQTFDDNGAPHGPPAMSEGTADDVLPDPVQIARLATEREVGPSPVPLYIRPADADPPRDAPPARIP